MKLVRFSTPLSPLGWCPVFPLHNPDMWSCFGSIMVGLGRLTRRLLLVGTGLQSLSMAVLVFGVIVYGVFWGGLNFDLARLVDARLLVIVLPGFAAFAGIWLKRKWGPVLAVVSSLLDLLWWGWVAFYAMRHFGGIGAFLPEYIFFALFYGSMVILAIKEYRNFSMNQHHF